MKRLPTKYSPTMAPKIAPVKPLAKPEIDIDVLSSISADILEDSFVYVHCYFNNDSEEMLIRVWKTTYLVDVSSGTRAKLVHAENISIAPQWTMIPPQSIFRFLLIFTSLPKSCTHFDLIEQIDQAGGFHIQNIGRNTSDVYHVSI